MANLSRIRPRRVLCQSDSIYYHGFDPMPSASRASRRLGRCFSNHTNLRQQAVKLPWWSHSSHMLSKHNIGVLNHQPQIRTLKIVVGNKADDTAAEVEEQPEPLSGSEEAEFRPPSISRALLFLAAFGTVAYGTAVYWSLTSSAKLAEEVRDPRNMKLLYASFPGARDIIRDSQPDWMDDSWGDGVTAMQLTQYRLYKRARRLEAIRVWMDQTCDTLGVPHSVKDSLVGRNGYMIKFSEASTVYLAVVPIIAVNTAVFLLWTGSRFNPRVSILMSKYFVHKPSSSRRWTMLSSTFSHREVWHYAFNNLALWSFSAAGLSYLLYHRRPNGTIPDASLTPHLLAFFATAGVFAATVSHIASAVRFRRIAQMAGLQLAKRTEGRHAFLGASGAVWAMITLSASCFPDANITILFLPFLTIPITYGVGGLIALDVIGAWRGWGLFEHFAHLGGAAFGFLYYQYGIWFWHKCNWWMAYVLKIGPYDPKRKQAKSDWD